MIRAASASSLAVMAQPSRSADNIVARAGSPTSAATSAMMAPVIIPSRRPLNEGASTMAGAGAVGKRGDRGCGRERRRATLGVFRRGSLAPTMRTGCPILARPGRTTRGRRRPMPGVKQTSRHGHEVDGSDHTGSVGIISQLFDNVVAAGEHSRWVVRSNILAV